MHLKDRARDFEMRMLVAILPTSHLQQGVHNSANARALGTKQLDAYKEHAHGLNPNTALNTAGNGNYWSGGVNGGSYSGPTSNSGGSETRSLNTAFQPVINL